MHKALAHPREGPTSHSFGCIELAQSRQPCGRGWFRELCFFTATPYRFPCLREGRAPTLLSPVERDGEGETAGRSNDPDVPRWLQGRRKEPEIAS
eukprot:9195527-Pyramimonas_sp.AAC.1